MRAIGSRNVRRVSAVASWPPTRRSIRGADRTCSGRAFSVGHTGWQQDKRDCVLRYLHRGKAAIQPRIAIPLAVTFSSGRTDQKLSRSLVRAALKHELRPMRRTANRFMLFMHLLRCILHRGGGKWFIVLIHKSVVVASHMGYITASICTCGTF